MQTGSKAPDFALEADDGTVVRLGELERPTVIYFYAEDGSKSCTEEAVSFSDLAADFEALGCGVIGISADSAEKHRRFKEKNRLRITLAVDPESKTAKAYGLWVEKSMYGRKYMGVERSTFLLGPDRTILRMWRKVKVKGHAQEVLSAAAAALQPI